jgi:hypothetical protein
MTKRDIIDFVVFRPNQQHPERVPVEINLVWDNDLNEWLLTPEAHEKLITARLLFNWNRLKTKRNTAKNHVTTSNP